MYGRRRQRTWWIPRVAAGLVVLVIGLWFGGHPSWLPGPVRSVFVSQSSQDRLVNQVLGLLSNDYYRKVDRTALVNQGLTAAVASLNDPYSHYYSPSDYQSFQNTETDPHDSGIGIVVNAAAGGLEVVEVFPGSPAARAGVVGGDVITAVGRTTLAGRAYTTAANLIKGRPGTSVTLTVREGHAQRRLTIRRADLTVPVTSSKVLTYHGRRLGYVRLTQFTVGSGAQVRSQVQQVLRQHVQGILLDLRENPGGLLEEAVNTASVFIPDGTIVSTDGRAQPREVYLAHNDAIAPTIPMVVLVDGGTASAAEIVTGALRDRGRATVVGTHTYGKGVFQEIQPLINGGALDFTVGEYFTPDGQNLGGGGVRRGAGIKPQVYAATSPTARTDTALLTAERVLAAKIR
jgi:carboxyl-terminal processing protease